MGSKQGVALEMISSIALAGWDHDGNAVNAETRGDGRGHAGPFPEDGDGSFSANLTLN